MITYDFNRLLECFDATCRFCLSQENCTQILSSEGIAEELMRAADFIVTKVDEHDGLPNRICQRCLKCVIDFADLEMRCQEAYEILQQIKDLQVETTVDDNATEELALSDESNANDIVEEEEITADFQESEVLSKEEILYDCSIESVVDLESLSTADIDETKSTIPAKTNQGTAKKGKQCPECGKFVSQLSKHLPTHSTVKRHSCSYCSKQFSHDTTLRKHIRSIHLKIKKYQCEHCSESFTDRSSLRYHDVVKHKDARNFTCEICNKSYYTSTGLQQHNSLTHEQRKFRCEECGKMFAMKYHLKDHEKTHSDARPFACAVCDKKFKRIKNLNEHLTVHTSSNRDLNST